MTDYTYMSHLGRDGDHILVFADGVFERKIFVDSDEFRPKADVSIVDSGWRSLFDGISSEAISWLESNPESPAKMVAIKPDMQMLSVGEFKNLYG